MMGTRERISSISLFSRSLRIFSALFLSSREALERVEDQTGIAEDETRIAENETGIAEDETEKK